MTGTLGTPVRGRLGGLLLASALGATLLVGGATPAAALHQHCGDDYPRGSLTSGHPDTDVPGGQWAGTHEVQRLETTIRNLEIAMLALERTAAVLVAGADAIHVVYDNLLKQGIFSVLIAEVIVKPIEVAVRVVATALLVARAAVFIAATVLRFELHAVGSGVTDEDTCGATLQGDAINTLWVALVQRNLSSSGPPLAVLLAPHDSSDARPWPLMPQHRATDFAWCPTIDLPAELPRPSQAEPQPYVPSGTDDCTPGVHTGFLDAPDIGVQAIVTRTLAHAQDHGLDVRGALDLLAVADARLADGAYKEAYAYYRRSYQEALRLTD